MILGLRRAAVSALLGAALFALSFPAIDDLARLLRGLAVIAWALALVFVLFAMLTRPRRASTDPADVRADERGGEPTGEPAAEPAVAEDGPQR